ncbi:MAG: GNAT family N-acetyltransferase [Frankiales bacterium]|nr:GNAT family N-acetyltransferase [Frankiales bacterium]
MQVPATRGWPAVLDAGPVTLRPLRLRDGPAWVEVRRRNIEWLRPWEASAPGAAYDPRSAVSASLTTYVGMTRRLRRQARHRQGYPFAVCLDGEFVGQLNVGGVTLGSLHSAHLGYWIDSAVAGRGVMPTAVALATDHCFWELGLHRLEVNIRPENTASRRVVEKLGFREEGVRPRYLHISGEWRDHICYALTSDEIPGGLLSAWIRRRNET